MDANDRPAFASRKSITFELNGTKFAWVEPVQSVSYRQRAALWRINAKAMDHVERNKDMGAASGVMMMFAADADFTADIMEFFIEFNPQVRDAQAVLWQWLGDGTLKDSELAEAYNKVRDFVLDPFVNGARSPSPSSQNGTESTATTTKQETTP